MRLEGKIALVTGAASGIGAATARLFAAYGAHVFGLDRDPSPERGDNPTHLTANVIDADPEAARRAQTELLPSKRIGTPEEVAHTALFLASDEARFINAIDTSLSMAAAPSFTTSEPRATGI